MKKGGIIAAILGVVLIVVGSIFLLTSGTKKTNKELFTEAVQKSLGLYKNDEGQDSVGEIEKTIEDIKEKIEKNFYKLTVNGKFTEGEAGFTKADATLYFGKKQAYLMLNSNTNDKIFNLEGMFKDNKLYFGMKDVLEKVYFIDNLDEIFDMVSNSGNSEIFEKIIKYLGDSIRDSIKEENVTNEQSELTINGKTYKTDKISYAFTGELLYDMVASFINKIKNDESIYNTLNKFIQDNGQLLDVPGEFSFSKDDFNKALDQLLELAKGLKDLGKLATLSIHLYDGEPISRQLTINIKNSNGNIPITIGDYKGEKYYKISISAMGQEAYKAEFKEQGANEWSISLFAMNEEILTGYYKNSDGNHELKLETAGNLSGTTILLKINKDWTGSFNMTNDDGELSIEYALEKVDEMLEMDVKNSVSYEEMTEADQEALHNFVNRFNIFGAKKQESSVNIPQKYDTSCHIEEDGTVVCNNM